MPLVLPLVMLPLVVPPVLPVELLASEPVPVELSLPVVARPAPSLSLRLSVHAEAKKITKVLPIRLFKSVFFFIVFKIRLVINCLFNMYAIPSTRHTHG